MIKKWLGQVLAKRRSLRAGLIGFALACAFFALIWLFQLFDSQYKGVKIRGAEWVAWLVIAMVFGLVAAASAAMLPLAGKLFAKLFGRSTNDGASGSAPRPQLPKRPILLLIIAAFFILQSLGMPLALIDHWDHFMKLIQMGTMSGFYFFTMLAFPSVAFMGAVALLLRKRAAILFFACYFFPGIAFIIAGQSGWAGYMNVPITCLAMIYSAHLQKKGMLT